MSVMRFGEIEMFWRETKIHILFFFSADFEIQMSWREKNKNAEAGWILFEEKIKRDRIPSATEGKRTKVGSIEVE